MDFSNKTSSASLRYQDSNNKYNKVQEHQIFERSPEKSSKANNSSIQMKNEKIKDQSTTSSPIKQSILFSQQRFEEQYNVPKEIGSIPLGQKNAISKQDNILMTTENVKPLSQAQLSGQKFKGQMFENLFEVMKTNTLQGDSTKRMNYKKFLFENKSQIDTKTSKLSGQYWNEQKQMVINKFQKRESHIKQKYQLEKERLKQQAVFLETEKDRISQIVDKLERKLEIEIELQNKSTEDKMLRNQGSSFQIAKNWLFSVILDMEKCSRFAKLKAQQQMEHVQSQKLKFQEFKIIKQYEGLVSLKGSLPLVKINAVTKPRTAPQTIKDAILDRIRQSGGDLNSLITESVEILSVVRSKPYIKQSSRDCKYVSSDQQRNKAFNLLSLFGNLDSFCESNDQIFHISHSRIEIEKNRKANCLDVSRIITINDFIKFNQDPEYCSRDLRIFVCSKQLSNIKKIQQTQAQMKQSQQNQKMIDESYPFKHLIDNQNQIGEKIHNSKKGWYYQYKDKVTQIKRIKGTNQLKIIDLSQNSSYSILDECILEHLFQSKVYKNYFSEKNDCKEDYLNISSEMLDEEDDDDEERYESDFEKEQNLLSNRSKQNPSQQQKSQNDKNGLTDFYIIEEFSPFSVQSGPPTGAIQKERKVSRIRQLTSMEIVSLITEFITIKKDTQVMEIKLQTDLIKRISDQGKANFQMKTDNLRPEEYDSNSLKAHSQSSNQSSQYFIVEKIDSQTGLLLKQYTVRVNYLDNRALMPIQYKLNRVRQQQCYWPNCLKILTEQDVQNQLEQRNNSLMNSVQNQGASSRKRPQSGVKGAIKNDQQQISSLHLTRLSFLYDLELKESPFLRFFKKFKFNKDKSSRTLAGAAQGQYPSMTASSNSTNTSLQHIGGSNGLGNNQLSSIQTLLNNMTAQSATNAQTQAQVIDGRQQQVSSGTQRKGESSKIITQSKQQRVDYVSQMELCQHHKSLESYITSRLGIAISPQGLICNSFVKALRRFEDWRLEIKSSLCFDVVVDTGKGNYLLENLHKMFNFTINQSKCQLGNPNIYNLIEVLQQQPQALSNIELHFRWIDMFRTLQKPIFTRNQHLSEANLHFLNQIRTFAMNLNQSVENERYIVTEILKWINLLSVMPVQFLKENFGQISEVLRNKDFVLKYQQFQFLNERINQLRSQKMNALGKLAAQQNLNQALFPQLASIPENLEVQLPKLTSNDPLNQGISYPNQFQSHNSYQNQLINGGDRSAKSSHNHQSNGNFYLINIILVVEKLTSIYGVALKKLNTNGEVPTQNVRQMIEQKLLQNQNQAQSDYNTGNSTVFKQPNNLMSRKYSAGSRRDFSLLPNSDNGTSIFMGGTQNTKSAAANQNENKSSLNIKMNPQQPAFIQPFSNEYTLGNQNTNPIFIDYSQTQKFGESGERSSNFNPNLSLQSSANTTTNDIKIKRQGISAIARQKTTVPQQSNNLNYQSSPLSRSLYKVGFGEKATNKKTKQDEKSGIQDNSSQMDGIIKVEHRQRASSAYKQRFENNVNLTSTHAILPQSNLQASNTNLIRPNSSTSQPQLPHQAQDYQFPLQYNQYPTNFSQMSQPQLQNPNVHQPYVSQIHQQYNIAVPQQLISFPPQQQQLVSQPQSTAVIAYSQQQPQTRVQNNHQFTAQQLQLQQIYNTKLPKPLLNTYNQYQSSQQQTQMANTVAMNNTQANYYIIAQPQNNQGPSFSQTKQRQQDRQNTIVMTYSNAVPLPNRIASANTDKDKKRQQQAAIMGGTFYAGNHGERSIVSGKKQKKQNRDQSERKQAKLNNFVKM